MKKARLTILFFLFLSQILPAQEGKNPFEINPASAEPIPIIEDTSTQIERPKTDNPFEISAKTDKVIAQPKKRGKTTSTSKKQSSNEQFLFFVILFMLLLLAILLTLFRSLVQRTYRAVINDSMMTQLYREREGSGGFTFTILYLMFIVNAGIFIYLISKSFPVDVNYSNFIWLSYCILGVAGLIFSRHFILTIIGNIFPVSKEVQLYSFTITIFGIMLGLFLVPVNIFVAFGPTEMVPTIIKGAIAFIVCIYLFRSLRGLFIANKFVVFHKFHFLLYICTVEIAPILIITKLLIRDIL